MKSSRFILTSIGLVLCGLGVSLFLASGLGVDPNSVFVTGIANKFSISYGVSSFIINGIIILMVGLIDSRYVGIGSILAVFLIGFSVDLFLVLFDTIGVFNNLNLLLRLMLSAGGLLIISFGIVIYINQDLGVAAFDSISEIISKKSGVNYRIIRIIIDLSMMSIGWYLGGVVGAGTVFISLGTGPSVQYIRSLLDYK